jgi:hypothetical protein
MKATCLALFVAFLPFASFADPLLVSPSADYAASGSVPDNIKAECKLPAAQSEAVVKELVAAGIPAQVAPSGGVPAKGRFLKLQIESAVSAGNAFMGHQKQVTTSAHLFQDGKEISQATKTRDSMGGVFAGYRGSCSVLHRCTNVLAKDVADWVKTQPGM